MRYIYRCAMCGEEIVEDETISYRSCPFNLPDRTKIMKNWQVFEIPKQIFHKCSNSDVRLGIATLVAIERGDLK